jgi:hypothetical protein
VSSAPLPGYPTSELARNRWVSLDLLLSIKRYAFESDPDNILRLDECTAVAALIVEQIEAVAAQGKLELLQDNASCLTSVLIVFLRKVSRRGYRDRLLYFRIPDLDLVAKSVRASGGCRPLNKPTRSHSSSGCLHATKEPPRGTPKLPRRSCYGQSVPSGVEVPFPGWRPGGRCRDGQAGQLVPRRAGEWLMLQAVES